MGSFLASFRALLLILKDIPASIGFVLQILMGEGVSSTLLHDCRGATPLDPPGSGLVMRETIEEYRHTDNSLVHPLGHRSQ